MPEGLSAVEAGKEVGEHAKHAGRHAEEERRERWITIAEAILLSLVTLAERDPRRPRSAARRRRRRCPLPGAARRRRDPVGAGDRNEVEQKVPEVETAPVQP